MDKDLNGYWAEPLEHIQEFVRAIARQASLRATWPALLVLTAAFLFAVAFIAQLIVEAFVEKLGFPLWLSFAGIGSLVYVVKVGMTISQRNAAMHANLSQHSRRLLPGVSIEDDGLIDQVRTQAEDMSVRQLPDIHVIISGVHSLDYAAFAPCGFVDRGRVAIHELVLNRYSPQNLTFLIRHELAHIKDRDGVVRAAIDVFRGAVDELGKGAMIYLFGGLAFVVIFVLLILSLTLILGQTTTEVAVAGVKISMPLIGGVAAVIAVINAVTAYSFWVCRWQEFKADAMAAAGLSPDQVRTGVELVQFLEGDAANLPQGSFLARLRWRMARTHPTPSQREERLRKAGYL